MAVEEITWVPHHLSVEDGQMAADASPHRSRSIRCGVQYVKDDLDGCRGGSIGATTICLLMTLDRPAVGFRVGGVDSMSAVPGVCRNDLVGAFTRFVIARIKSRACFKLYAVTTQRTT